MADWHYSKGGEKLGPVSQDELLGLLSSGELQGSDLVWSEGMENWAVANSVPELAEAIPSGPPPPSVDEGGPPPMPAAQANEDFFKKLGLEGILVGAGAGVMLIACLLPWVSGFFTYLGIQVWAGIICLLCAVGAGVCFGLYNFKPGLKENKQNALSFSIVFTSTGGLAVLLSFIFIVSVTAGIGSVFALLGGGALTAGGVMSLLAVKRMPA
ncbi:MAG: DUF4339 domain-containing protein [Planctomycetes bacterium]|nr:DUF4339 domain-containing protein [Planctomycetota bacterium]